MIGFGQTAEDYYNKASNYENNGEYELAIYNYTNCLRIDPDFTSAYLLEDIHIHSLETTMVP